VTTITKVNLEILRKTNRERTAVVFADWLLWSAPQIKSILDIGCGDGIVATRLPRESQYAGFDIGADIYPRASSPNIEYVDDIGRLEQKLTKSEQADAVLLFDVLEHTPTFTGLFDIALTRSKRFVLVSLPNEANFRSAVRLLRDELPGAHGVRMVQYKSGHRHQWLVNISQARKVLEEVSHRQGFHLSTMMHIANESPNAFKRTCLRLVTWYLPWRLRSDQFALLFEKLDA